MENILLLINGHMGAGKSTTAKLVAEKIEGRILILEIDQIKRMFARYKANKKENLQLSYEISNKIIDESLKNNVSVIVDKSIDSDQVKMFEETASVNNAKVVKIFLDISFETQILRLNKRRVENGEVELTEEETKELQSKYLHKSSDGFAIVSSEQPTESIVEEILIYLMT